MFGELNADPLDVVAMTEAIGNIIERIAAIATVATSFHPAIQIRHEVRARVLGAGLVAFDSLGSGLVGMHREA